MKKLKKFMLIVLVFVSTIFALGFLNVKAAVAPDTIKLKSKSSLYYFNNGTDYISGYNFYRKQLTDGTYAYCVSNIDKSVPAGKTLSSKGAITNKGLDYILKNGYPNASFTGNDKKDYYITQSAIWLYFDQTNGSGNWKGTSFNAKSTGMKKYVYDLVEAAKSANNGVDEDSTITLIYLDKTLTLKGDYFVSQPIKVTTRNTKGTYNVVLTDAPVGTIVKSQTGEVKTTFNDSEQFVIYVPANSISNGQKGNVSFKVEAEGVTYRTYYYATSGGYQKIAPTVTYEDIKKIASDVLTFTYEKDKTQVRISKQDIANKQELPGATLQVKDKNGKVVDEWVSTTEPHYIVGLEPGEYTLTEKIAPNGYILSTETITFTVTANGSVTSVTMYNSKKEVTKVRISKQDIASKQELPGATLQVKDKNGKVIDEWVSTTEAHYIEGLEPGNYTLTETIAPEGYILSTETITFTVKDDGSVTSVTMYNAKETKVTKVKISKQDMANKQELPGATLQVKDKNGKVVDEWVSTTEPHYIEGLEPGEYTLTETIAPEGYALSTETITFTVKDDGSVASVTMYNTKYTEVPITDLNVSSVTMIAAVVLITLGTGLVVYYAKYAR